MASNIDPSISLAAKPPAAMTLPEMLNFARGAQLYQREQEVLPEQVEQARIATQTARTGQEQAAFTLSKDQNNALMGIVGGFRNDPRIASGNPDAALSALDEIKAKAVNLNIPRSMVERIAGTATNIAINNPKRLPQYFDNVIQSQAGASAQLGLQTPEIVTQGLPKPGLFTRAEGVVRELPTIDQPNGQPQAGQPQAGQPQAGQPQAGAPSQRDVIAEQLRPSQLRNPGYPLNFKPRPPEGSMRPVTEPEQAAINEGRKFREVAAEFSDQAPGVIDRVDRVLQTVASIESSREFKAGKAGELEARLRQAFGEAEYKLLQKELADLVIQTNQVTGGKTDAASALVAQSTGDISYPPGVLKNVVTKLRGDAYGAMMKAQGAQAFINNGFGEANLRNYRDAWNKNADPRVFEAMAIFGSDRLTADQKKAAFDKIKPTNLESLDAFERKYTNLESLARTGALPPPQRPAR